VKPIPGVFGDASGIPGTVLAAYQKAARDLAMSMPGCHITWPLLAGIGKVESGHASGGKVDANGNTRGKILGPVLDGGPGTAAIADTDQGAYDGNTAWDRAVGPMQFIPGTWNAFGADGNGDGLKDPHNVFDASRAAGDYLCAGGANLSDPQGLVQAVLRYNHSMDYVSTVLRWMQTYSKDTVTIPDKPGVIDTPDDDGNNGDDRDTTRTTASPSTTAPTTAPTTVPTTVPTTAPTTVPPTVPTSSRPVPSATGSSKPTPTGTVTRPPLDPTSTPTKTPTNTPTNTQDTPTTTPTTTTPTTSPTGEPTSDPTCTTSPTTTPSTTPTSSPTLTPTPPPCSTAAPNGESTASPSDAPPAG
jgi:hypothetical protein